MPTRWLLSQVLAVAPPLKYMSVFEPMEIILKHTTSITLWYVKRQLPRNQPSPILLPEILPFPGYGPDQTTSPGMCTAKTVPVQMLQQHIPLPAISHPMQPLQAPTRRSVKQTIQHWQVMLPPMEARVPGPMKAGPLPLLQIQIMKKPRH